MAKIAFINTLKVPSGEASVNRILSLAKGLVENGDEVHILSSNVCREYSKGEEIDGAKVFNLGKKNGTIGLTMALKRICSKIKKEKYDAVISTTNSLLLIYPLYIICHTARTKLIQEKSEFPFVMMKKGFFNRLWGSFYVNTTYKLMDGMIVMTLPLLDFFKKKVKKKCELIHIPMTVDSQRFSIPKTESEYGDYIAYCGNMSGNKDGVHNLIEAFSQVIIKNTKIKLLLIGGTDNEEELMKIKVHANQISPDRILLFGRASREEIPRLLKNAKVLALARPSSLQSTGGFPTKLGEYLSTGNPVVVTAVGDIPRYLNQNNSYLIKPDDNKEFAKGILSAYLDEEQSKSIGLNGKQLVETIFDYRVQCRNLHNYINKQR